MRTTLATALAAAWFLNAGEAPARAPAPPGLEEGWERAVPVPSPLLGEGDRYVVWVAPGWLPARRETATGGTDWPVVLAPASEPDPPVVSAPAGTFRFEASYR